MKIDGNELAILQNDLDREGKKEEALKIKLEFLRQVREAGDHCPCKEACRHHGNCFECVTIHRGHRDHLPMCLWDMVNERLAALSHMTEGTRAPTRTARPRKAPSAVTVPTVPAAENKYNGQTKAVCPFLSADKCIWRKAINARQRVPFLLSAEMTFCDEVRCEKSSIFAFACGVKTQVLLCIQRSILYSSSCLMRSSASGAC